MIIILIHFHPGATSQKWKLLPNAHLKHLKSNLCLDSRRKDEIGVVATKCDEANDNQRWHFSKT